jgi:hypothetical protein
MKVWNDILTAGEEPGTPVEIGPDDKIYEALNNFRFKISDPWLRV